MNDMSVPSTTRAVVITSQNNAAVKTVSTPKLRDDYVLVKTTAVGLNPTDWKGISADWAAADLRVGCDYAGVVVKVGSKVTKAFKPGDRIAGFAHGSNLVQPEDGAFAEYIVAKGDVQLKVPDNISDEEAATLGVGISTVGQGLYQSLGLPWPSDAAAVRAASGTPILIYGGSTATGILGVQFAKLSGFRVLTTCSPRNFDYVRSLGADEVYDYGAADWVEAVRASTGGKLRYAWDCISLEDSARACAAALDSDREGALYGHLLGIEDEVVRPVNAKMAPPRGTMAYTGFGEHYVKWKDTPAKPEDFEFARRFWDLAGRLIAEGKVKPARPDVDRGGKGLEAVLGGLEQLKEGKVSGVKLVYHI